MRIELTKYGPIVLREAPNMYFVGRTINLSYAIYLHVNELNE